MSDPPNTERRKSSRDLTPIGLATLRQLALKAVTRQSGAAEDAATLAAAARQAYDDLAGVATPLIGQVGVDALTGRALHLAQREYSWLVDAQASGPPPEPFGHVTLILQRQDPAVGLEAIAAVFAIFAGLLVTFIGESLTMGLLRKAWPGAFADARTEET
jgi:hypothetical protein